MKNLTKAIARVFSLRTTSNLNTGIEDTKVDSETALLIFEAQILRAKAVLVRYDEIIEKNKIQLNKCRS